MVILTLTKVDLGKFICLLLVVVAMIFFITTTSQWSGEAEKILEPTTDDKLEPIPMTAQVGNERLEKLIETLASSLNRPQRVTDLLIAVRTIRLSPRPPVLCFTD
eukprot:GHVN01081475.1.p2 GENE.GHVN01081475.1~~GHVN01081475.1.p2  ORF type:complete len:105 (-),score=2.58 GHVN01081475.1:1515-1829(-)